MSSPAGVAAPASREGGAIGRGGAEQAIAGRAAAGLLRRWRPSRAAAVAFVAGPSFPAPPSLPPPGGYHRNPSPLPGPLRPQRAPGPAAACAPPPTPSPPV